MKCRNLRSRLGTGRVKQTIIVSRARKGTEMKRTGAKTVVEREVSAIARTIVVAMATAILTAITTTVVLMDRGESLTSVD